jgi:tRNA threonylcarbamoyl adenosine modification protein (Sua5/YciO/YrdC/YwlC family)
MSQIFAVHPDNPQARLLRQAVSIIAEGGLIVYPTDSGYAFGCRLGCKSALERIKALRQLDKYHNMTMVTHDLSQLGLYARVSKPIYRMLKAFTPGAYTFILNASREVPRLMLHPKRKTLGLRVPDNTIALALLECNAEPLMSCSLLLPGAEAPMTEPEAIYDVLGNRVDLVINGGLCSHQPTTVIDFTGDVPVIVRNGKGDINPFTGIG